MSKRALKGVLDNFLGTYTSRYSDHDGYWLFGMLASELGELRIDLLHFKEGTIENTPLGTATKLAGVKFREQLEKAGIAASSVQEAYLIIKKLPNATSGFVNGRRSSGWMFQLAAGVASHSGFTCEREKSIFVAPHDPQVEQRNSSAIQG